MMSVTNYLFLSGAAAAARADGGGGRLGWGRFFPVGQGPADLLPGRLLALIEPSRHGAVLPSAEAQDFRLPGHGVEQDGRAPARKPPPGLTWIDDQGSGRLPYIHLVGVAVNKHAGGMLGQERLQPLVAVDEQKSFSRIFKGKRLVPDFVRRAQDGFQAPALAVAVAENSPHRAAGFFQLAGGEWSDEITGMDDQLAAAVPEQADRPADGRKVVMRICQYPNHN
jgi:hypothetical protein